jgi:hypothetical protein
MKSIILILIIQIIINLKLKSILFFIKYNKINPILANQPINLLIYFKMIKSKNILNDPLLHFSFLIFYLFIYLYFRFLIINYILMEKYHLITLSISQISMILLSKYADDESIMVILTISTHLVKPSSV